jgi:hypothetical protein
MIGVVPQQHGGIAAVIILVARLFGGPHPGRRLVGPTGAGGQKHGRQQNRQNS